MSVCAGVRCWYFFGCVPFFTDWPIQKGLRTRRKTLAPFQQGRFESKNSLRERKTGIVSGNALANRPVGQKIAKNQPNLR